jgi:hypothetical protein
MVDSGFVNAARIGWLMGWGWVGVGLGLGHKTIGIPRYLATTAIKSYNISRFKSIYVSE